MENQEVLRSKPLSYEASKAVLKSLSLETRESIDRRIPALCTVNSRLPYVLENVVIGDDFFETDGRRWIITPVWVQSSENPLRQRCSSQNGRRNSLAILDKPEIKTCKNLTVEFCFGSRPTNFSNDKLLRLRNQHLKLENYGLTLHELQLFVQDWITTGRDIGTRFSWEPRPFDDVVNHLNRLTTHFGAVEAGSHLDYYFSHKTICGKGVALKMGEDRELVMYCGESKTDYLWTFEMEVVASTTSAFAVPTSND